MNICDKCKKGCKQDEMNVCFQFESINQEPKYDIVLDYLETLTEIKKTVIRKEYKKWLKDKTNNEQEKLERDVAIFCLIKGFILLEDEDKQEQLNKMKQRLKEIQQ